MLVEHIMTKHVVSVSMDATLETMRDLFQHCKFHHLVVTDDKIGVVEKYAPAFGLPPEVVANAPFFQIGSLEHIKENFQMMRERWGITYIVCQNDGTIPLSPIVAELAGK